MNEDIKSHVDRLKEILCIALDETPASETVVNLDNEVEYICGSIFEMLSDSYIGRSDQEERLSLEYFEGKLFAMKDAVRSALGFDRDGSSAETIISNFEHFSYLVKTALPR